MKSRTRKLAASAALVAVSAVWGVTFVTVKQAIATYPLFAFLGWRFAIATLAVIVMFPGVFRRFRKDTLRTGLLAAAFLTAGYVFQTWGLAGTSASKAAFITGLFVVFTPVAQALVLRHVPPAYAWAGAGVALAGMWLLTGGIGGWGAGDTRVFLCSLAYTGHMIVLGGPGRDHDPIALTLVQQATAAVVCGAGALALGGAPFPAGWPLWSALLVTGVLASAVAFVVQTSVQRWLSPARTALILVCEPAFGGLFGWWLAGDMFGAAQIAGAALMLGGMVTSEAAAFRREGSAVEARILAGPEA